MIQIDMLVYHARQLVTCASPNGPKRGAAMQDVGLLEDGAIAIADQKIVAVGPSSELLERFAPRFSLDATDKVVCPGFVDPHTHVVFAGDRVNEFEMRIKGASYMEIMEAGGGIISSARQYGLPAWSNWLQKPVLVWMPCCAWAQPRLKSKPVMAWTKPAR